MTDSKIGHIITFAQQIHNSKLIAKKSLFLVISDDVLRTVMIGFAK